MRKYLSIVLVIIIIISNMYIPSVFAEDTFYINGKSISIYSSPWPGNSQCWTYANNIYKAIWGVNFNSNFNDSSNMLRNLGDSDLEFTIENTKKYISQAAVGSVIRICNYTYLHSNDGWGHNFIIAQKDSNGFTTMESISKAPDGRRSRYWTYEEFARHNSSHYKNESWCYRYIKYIKWPGASAYSPGHTHSWSYTNESGHPHKQIRSCSCGERQYTGAVGQSGNCSSCYPLGNVSLTRSVNKNIYEVTFYRNDVPNANKYTLTLYRNGSVYGTFNMNSSSYTARSLVSGTYYATLKAENTSTNSSKSTTCDTFTLVDSYPVTYDANGGSSAPSQQYKIKEQDLTLTTATPSRKGYVFKGWSLNKNALEAEYASGGVYTKDTKATLYAIWEPEIYSITFDVNGGRGENSSVTVTYGNTVQAPNFTTKDGSYLKGWATSKTAKSPDYRPGMDFMPDSNITLYAIWGTSTWGGDIAEGFSGGDGTEENPYQIATAAELAYLAHTVNTQQSAPEYKYYILTDNISLGYEEWVPIGIHDNENQYFCGSFDGNGYTISDLCITEHRMHSIGLFGYICDSDINNLTVSGDIIVDGDLLPRVATIVGHAKNSDIAMCKTLYSSISTQTYHWGYIGGICGAAEGTVTISGCESQECYTYIEEHRNASEICLGMILGGVYDAYVDTKVSITDCMVNSTEELFGASKGVVSNAILGGICGSGATDLQYREEELQILRCTVNASKLFDNISADILVAGGIIGAGGKTIISQCSVNFFGENKKDIDGTTYNCSIYGTLESYQNSSFGGIAGSAGSIDNCKYNGKSVVGISESDFSKCAISVGGIAGYGNEIDKCFANVEGVIYSGTGNSIGMEKCNAGGIAASLNKGTNLLAIADSIITRQASTTVKTNAGDIYGETNGDSTVEIDNVYANSGMELDAVNTLDSKYAENNYTASRRTLTQIKRASLLRNIFGEYKSMEYLKEDPEAVWVIRDGEYPELYFNLLRNISVSEVENGTVSVDKTQAIDGEIVNVTAEPANGYVLNGIYVDGEKIIGETFEVLGDSEVYALFAKKTETFEIKAESDTNASISIVNLDKSSKARLLSTSNTITADDGEEIAVNTQPTGNYTVDAIYVNGEEMLSESFIVKDDSNVTMEVKSLDTVISATTGDANDIGNCYVTLSGSIDEEIDSAEKYIRYWKTSSPEVVYTTESEISDGEYSVIIEGLEPNTEYQYQMTENGEIKAFTTLSEELDGGGVPDEVYSGENSSPNDSYPISITEFDKNNGMIRAELKNVGSSNLNLKAVIVAYNSYGMAMNIEATDIDNLQVNAVSYAYASITNGASYYKVYVWDKINLLKPLCKVKQYSYSN